MKKLTAKQEAFVQHLTQGKSQLESYRLAFNNNKGTDKTIKVKASKLYNEPHVKARYTELIGKKINTVKYTTSTAYENLMLVIDYAKKDLQKKGITMTNTSAIIKASEQLNKLFLIDSLEHERLKLEIRKIELSESKLKKENEQLQNEKGDLLRELIANV